MTPKQRQLIHYIEGHGHRAYALTTGDAVLAISEDQHGRKHWDMIPALWLTVREWLGY